MPVLAIAVVIAILYFGRLFFITSLLAVTIAFILEPFVGLLVRIHEEGTAIGDYIYSRLSSFYQIMLMASFIPFLVYFMLSWRDHITRSFLQFFHGEDRLIAARSMQGIADMVRAFVVGNFILGMMLAMISSVLFWTLHVPYPMLVGPLSGFMSLVPYIGLLLAMIPPLFAALLVNT